MNDGERPGAGRQDESGDAPDRSPSLPLLYSLIALALAAAIGLALLIVLPFHQRR
jgi:hypothetical protein